jgi:hypothetical protein
MLPARSTVSWVVRFSKEPDPTRRAELISSETGLLAAAAQISPLPVPEPLFTDPQQGCWAYSKIPGVPLLDLPQWRHSWTPRHRTVAVPWCSLTTTWASNTS